LSEHGLGDRVGRIHAPVGLALGGRSPSEIAVAILAQIVQERYRDNSREQSYHALVLAAGASSRMQGRNKLLCEVDGQP